MQLVSLISYFNARPYSLWNLMLGKELTVNGKITALCQTNIAVSQATKIHNKNKLYRSLFSPLTLPFHFHVLHNLSMHLRSSLALVSLVEVVLLSVN